MGEKTAGELCRQQFVSARLEEPVSALLGRLVQANEFGAIVFDGAGRFIGSISKDGLLKKRVDFSSLKVKSLPLSKAVVFADEPLSKVVELLLVNNVQALPVVDNKSLLGLVWARDVVRALEPLSDWSAIPAREIASLPTVLARDSDSLERTISLMQSYKVHRVPVVGADGSLLGLFSFSDFVQGVAFREVRSPRGRLSKNKDRAEFVGLLEKPVSFFVSSNPIVADPSDSMGTIVNKLLHSNISSVVLVSQRKPVGIITLRDVLKHATTKPESPGPIRLAHLPSLDEVDVASVKQLCSDFLDRYMRFVSAPVLEVRCKQHRKTDSRIKHSVRVLLSSDGHSFSAASTGWNFVNALQVALKTVLVEVRKFKQRERSSRKKAKRL